MRSLRSASPAPRPRPDPRLEPLEPRILLWAEVGLLHEQGLAFVALAPELQAPQVEIHDEALVRESSHPDPEAVEPSASAAGEPETAASGDEAGASSDAAAGEGSETS